MIVKILLPNAKGQALAQAGNKFYIIPSNGYYRNQEVVLNEGEGKELPSLLYAIAELDAVELNKMINIVKENW